MALSMYTNNTTPFGSYIGADGYFVVSDGVQYYLAEYDINCDEINELLLLEETASNDSEWVTEILDIFTFYNGEPIWLIAGEYRGTIDLCEDGIIRFVGSGGAEAHIYDFYKILNGKLDLCDRAEENWGVYMVNGEECSVDKFNHTIDKYPLRAAPDYDLIEVITP